MPDNNERDPRDPPVMNNYLLLATMRDGGQYRVDVDAQSLEDACREIIHTQMAKGIAVKSIGVIG